MFYPARPQESPAWGGDCPAPQAFEIGLQRLAQLVGQLALAAGGFERKLADAANSEDGLEQTRKGSLLGIYGPSPLVIPR